MAAREPRARGRRVRIRWVRSGGGFIPDGRPLGELILIVLLIVLLFGANRLPRAGAGLGRAIRSFKDALAGKDEQGAGEAGREPGGGKRP